MDAERIGLTAILPVIAEPGTLAQAGQTVLAVMDTAELASQLSAAQADRANALNEELYGPEFLGPSPLAARPYMGPALTRELPKLPPLWANSVH